MSGQPPSERGEPTGPVLGEVPSPVAQASKESLQVGKGKGRPERPPVRGADQPYALPDPEVPPHLEAIRQQAFKEALQQGAKRPASVAFRNAVSVFVDHNDEFAAAQAEREGLTVGEVEELTHLGMLAQHSQRWENVEDVLGEALNEDTRAQAETMLSELNGEFTAKMREMVKEGATLEERQALIRQTLEDYKRRYFEATGMNQELLEALLAGDSFRKYAGSPVPPEALRAGPRETGPVQDTSPEPPVRPEVPPGDDGL